MKARLMLVPTVLLFSPLIASASSTEDTIVQIANVFNVFAGFVFVASVMLFAGGFIVWLARLGTAPRADGIHIMQWAVTTLFVLVVLLGIVEYVERHTQGALYIISFVIIILIIWMVIASGIVGGGGGGEKHEE